jgi:hypothetical protein
VTTGNHAGRSIERARNRQIEYERAVEDGYAPPGGGGGVITARVAEIGDDHLVCQTLDADGLDAGELLVAKPFWLRRSSLDGVTIDGWTYTWIADDEFEVANAQYTATALVSPPWVPDELLGGDPGLPTIKVAIGVGYTGVTVDDVALADEAIADGRTLRVLTVTRTGS